MRQQLTTAQFQLFFSNNCWLMMTWNKIVTFLSCSLSWDKSQCLQEHWACLSYKAHWLLWSPVYKCTFIYKRIFRYKHTQTYRLRYCFIHTCVIIAGTHPNACACTQLPLRVGLQPVFRLPLMGVSPRKRRGKDTYVYDTIMWPGFTPWAIPTLSYMLLLISTYLNYRHIKPYHWWS